MLAACILSRDAYFDKESSSREKWAAKKTKKKTIYENSQPYSHKYNYTIIQTSRDIPNGFFLNTKNIYTEFLINEHSQL